MPSSPRISRVAAVANNSNSPPAAALPDRRALGQSRGLAAALGLDPVGLWRGGGGLRRQSAGAAARPRAGGAGGDRARLPRLHPLHLQPLPARSFPRPPTGAELNPDPAGPRPRLPSAHALSRLCRPLHGLLLRRRRSDRGPGRCRLGALGPALDAGRLDLPHRRHRAAAAGGPITPWAGAAGGSGIRSRTPPSCPGSSATALLHSAIVVEKRDALKGWTILLAILAFGFSLIGTFLVRSGVITSVHAFAIDPARGAVHPGAADRLYRRRAAALRLAGALASRAAGSSPRSAAKGRC